MSQPPSFIQKFKNRMAASVASVKKSYGFDVVNHGGVVGAGSMDAQNVGMIVRDVNRGVIEVADAGRRSVVSLLKRFSRKRHQRRVATAETWHAEGVEEGRVEAVEAVEAVVEREGGRVDGVDVDADVDVDMMDSDDGSEDACPLQLEEVSLLMAQIQQQIDIAAPAVAGLHQRHLNRMKMHDMQQPHQRQKKRRALGRVVYHCPMLQEAPFYHHVLVHGVINNFTGGIVYVDKSVYPMREALLREAAGVRCPDDGMWYWNTNYMQTQMLVQQTERLIVVLSRSFGFMVGKEFDGPLQFVRAARMCVVAEC
jgi:hypothetical protein